MSRNFDNILNDCLERMAAGEDIQQCVSRYPEQAAELSPLLRVAATTMRAASYTTYEPLRSESLRRAKAQGLSRLMRTIQEKGVPKRSRFAFAFPFFSQPMLRPLAIAFAAVFLVSVAATGTTVASSDAVPGEPLYWVKTTREAVSLNLMPRSDMEKAEIHAALANERAGEMRALVLRGRYDDAERHARTVTIHLSQSADYAGIVIIHRSVDTQPPRARFSRNDRQVAHLREMLERDSLEMRALMQDVMRQAPPGQQRRIEQVMYQSDLGFRIMIGALEGGNSPEMRQFWTNVPPPRSLR
ncbi:MAG: DUF5667 domain-containing protein [Chloroflexi bacterium]|nr:DUF5667 domain-containing protein [Chloroflexota bacterium]